MHQGCGCHCPWLAPGSADPATARTGRITVLILCCHALFNVISVVFTWNISRDVSGYMKTEYRSKRISSLETSVYTDEVTNSTFSFLNS